MALASGLRQHSLWRSCQTAINGLSSWRLPENVLFLHHATLKSIRLLQRNKAVEWCMGNLKACQHYMLSFLILFRSLMPGGLTKALRICTFSFAISSIPLPFFCAASGCHKCALTLFWQRYDRRVAWPRKLHRKCCSITLELCIT